jgi:site-specific recombinase XerD
MPAFTVTSDPTHHPSILVVGPDDLPVQSIADYLRSLDIRGRSGYTLRAYALGLSHFFTWLRDSGTDADAVTHHVVEQYIGAFAHSPKGGACPPSADRAGQVDHLTRTVYPTMERQPRTINHRLSVLASYYAFRIQRDTEHGSGPWHLRENPVTSRRGGSEQRHVMEGRDAPIRRRSHDFQRRVPHRVPSRLDPGFAEQIIATAASWRDTAILTLLYRTGQRIGDWRDDTDRHGVLGMTLADVDERGQSITVRLKGARDEHRVPVTDDFWPIYHRYLAEERTTNSPTTAIWVSFRKGRGAPLSYQAFESSLRVIGRKLGAHLHAHLFRHTLAQAVLETTGSLKVTQELLGHAQLSTTADQYARVNQQALVEAVAAVKTAFDGAIRGRPSEEGTVPRYVFAYDRQTVEELDRIALSPTASGERS